MAWLKEGWITFKPSYNASVKVDGIWKPAVIIRVEGVPSSFSTEPRMAALFEGMAKLPYMEGGSSKDFDPNKEPDHLFRIVAWQSPVTAIWFFEPEFLPSSIQKANSWDLHNLPGGNTEGLTPTIIIFGLLLYNCDNLL